MAFMLAYCGNNGVGKRLPAMTEMGTGFTSFYGESGIEQEYTLFCPIGQITAEGRCTMGVVNNLLENIAQ